MSYDFQAVEKKWKKEWADNPIALSKPTGDGKKYYCLDMFPYPSGSGLHVGHWRGYVLSDVYSRMKWLEGYNVLHPMGWDAFGLPAENAAIKQGVHPKTATQKNIATFKTQLADIGAMYDWRKELSTTDPEYYKWTQWIFLLMYKRGLAYEDTLPINWCPSCLTGLANEEVVDGACERCGSQVEQKNIRQWALKITEYAQKLLDGLDTLEWPEKVLAMQRNWIGKSEGMRIQFESTDQEGNQVILPAFTTRPDTIFGVTFLVIAPDLPIVDALTVPEQRKDVAAFQEQMAHQSARERQQSTEKLGVFTGAYALNPANNTRIPIYCANYVLSDYGTGIVMGVPCDDERDKQFAQKYDLAVTPVIDYETNCLINSEQFTGLSVPEQAIQAISEWLERKGVGEKQVTYKLRDWIFSRQRYWGEPIPLIHCPQDGIVPVPEKDLPVMLPDVKKYEPTGTGESPLADIASWVNVPCPVCGGPAKRETNTMPQWAGSCWYFLRYPNPNLDSKPFDAKDVDYWLPVDLYVGGIEHAILHLLYARFYTHVLHDAGYLPFSEPFTHLFNQGMILKYSEKSGHVEKMSKSKGNVVNPDEIVRTYGSDVLRLYMLFIGPPELDCEWQDSGLDGIKRFVNRVWNYLSNPSNLCDQADEAPAVSKRFHKFMKQFQNRLDHFKPNTAIAAMMELMNDLIGQDLKLGKESAQQFISMLSTMAPFMAAQLLQDLYNTTLKQCHWPVYDEERAQDDEITMIVQVNGKLRGNVRVAKDASQQEVEPAARAVCEKWFDAKEVKKVIFVKNRLINFVVV